jgi:hypothetical protein
MASEHPTTAVLQETCRNLAVTLSAGLTSYADALNWLAHYVVTRGSDEAREQLELYARNIGLEIVAMSRIADVLRDAWRVAPPELDLRPALPLAAALGESYVLFLAVDSPEIAERLPVISIERTRELFTSSVRTWMSHHVDELPELRALAAPDGG